MIRRTRISRLPPVNAAELTEEQADALSPFGDLSRMPNVLGAYARHPRALKAYHVWARFHNEPDNALAMRETELVMIRAMWRIGAEYPFTRHKPIGQKFGLTAEEVEALKKPVDAHDWSAPDRALVEAADALTQSFNIPDRIWLDLTAHFNELQIIEAILACGHYCATGMFLNAAGIELDASIEEDPDTELVK